MHSIQKLLTLDRIKKMILIFNMDGSHTLISASSSGSLQEKRSILSKKCTTIFLASSVKKEHLFGLDIQKNSVQKKDTTLIPLTSEDFSLNYAKPKEFIITKDEVDKLDKKKLIQKLLEEPFKNVEYNIKYKEDQNKCVLKFDNDWINDKLCKYKKEILDRCLLSNKDNLIINSEEDTYIYPLKKNNVIEVKQFLDHKSSKVELEDKSSKVELEDKSSKVELEDKSSKVELEDKSSKVELEDKSSKVELEDKNVIVCLNQPNSEELIRISQRLREHKVFNVTYIIGILLTENMIQSKSLQGNICFNDTEYKYGFYCWLDLPLLTIKMPCFAE